MKITINKILFPLVLGIGLSACSFRESPVTERTINVQRPYTVRDESNSDYNARIFRENSQKNEADLKARQESDRVAKEKDNKIRATAKAKEAAQARQDKKEKEAKAKKDTKTTSETLK